MSMCETCRFWAKKDRWADTGTCNLVTSASGMRRKTTTARIFPNGQGHMETSPSFGCVLHEHDRSMESG